MFSSSGPHPPRCLAFNAVYCEFPKTLGEGRMPRKRHTLHHWAQDSSMALPSLPLLCAPSCTWESWPR